MNKIFVDILIYWDSTVMLVPQFIIHDTLIEFKLNKFTWYSKFILDVDLIKTVLLPDINLNFRTQVNVWVSQTMMMWQNTSIRENVENQSMVW